MVPILVDIYKANGVMSMNYSFKLDYTLDSSLLYGWVMDKHNITKAQFDSSLVYYTKKTDALNKIYDKVITQLSKMQDNLSSSNKNEETKTNVIWKEKRKYHLPVDGPRSKVPFNVAITETGLYTISAKIQIRNIDQSVNPHITAYFWYNDGSETGKREYFNVTKLRKDGYSRNYSCSKRLTNKKYTHIKGYILDDDNKEPGFIKQAIVSDLIITIQK